MKALKALYKRYETVTPIGVVGVTNCFGLLVFEPLPEDRADAELVTAWSGSEGKRWNYRRHIVRYTTSGRPYINKGGSRYYLDEIMRV